jgi:pyruvate formate lyase activating enzyme
VTLGAAGAMSELGVLEAGSRHDLRVGRSPDAPDESRASDDSDGAFGYVHSYETASRFDGPGLRVVLFTSGCLLRCTYCHNPDTWHLKDGTYIAAQQVLKRLRDFAPALRALDGGLTISGGEPMVQLAFTRRIFRGAKALGLNTAIETSGFLGERADEDYLAQLDLVLLDIKSGNPETYRNATGRDLAPTLRFAERLAAIEKPVWVRFTLVPGLTDDPANVESIARFVAPMKNVRWVEVQPFHQMGEFKWKAMGLDYRHNETHPPTPDLTRRVIEQFKAAGCNAR